MQYTMHSISILIPTLNEEKSIGGLIEFLLSLPPAQIVICDGGSQDATLSICARYPVQIVKSAPGRGRQLNCGAKLATGDILFFLHADSRLQERCLQDIKQAIAAGKQWGCCTLAFDKNTPLYKTIAFMSNLRVRWTSSCYGDQGIYCAREAFQARGGFPDWTLLEDLEFSRKMRSVSRAYMVPGRITTKARRFEKNGPWRTICKMQMIKILFLLGRSPEKLAKWYG